MVRYLRPRQGRRFACPPNMKGKEDVCQDILQGVWQLKWEPDRTIRTIPPSPYIEYWLNCVQEAEEPDLWLNDHGIVTNLINRLTPILHSATIATAKTSLEGEYHTATGYPVTITGNNVGKVLEFALKLRFHVNPQVDWLNPPTLSLAQTIQGCVPQQSVHVPGTQGRLSTDFCAKHLWRKAGLDIHWTDDLSEHLALREGKHIYIFRHSSSLKALLDNPASDPFPPNFTSETLETLYLLFRPLESKMHKRNARRMDKHLSFDLELAMGEHAIFDLNNYHYWHARLRAIQDAYDASMPSGLRQWWFDRRNRVNWATFWIAFVVFVLTVVFGVVQSVTGILQVWVAYHPVAG